MEKQWREMVVTGEGKVTTVFDEIVVNCTIDVADQRSLKQALQQHSEKVHNFLEFLQGEGVPLGKIQMIFYHYGPKMEYEYIDGKQKQVQKGYEVIEKFQFRDALDKGPSLIEGMAPYASLDSTQFDVSRRKEFHEDAVDLAIANASEKAQRRAGKLNVVVGRVLHFAEGMVHVPHRRGEKMYAMAAMADAQAAPELPAGEAEIHAFVTVVYEIL